MKLDEYVTLGRTGVYDDLPPYLAMALGAGETTLLRLTTAYCAFVNGGKQVHATLIDRIQDRYGKTIWHHDSRECQGCAADSCREARFAASAGC